MVGSRAWMFWGLVLFPLLGFAEGYSGGVSPGDVSKVLVQMGYEAEAAVDSEGDPMLHSRADDHPFSIYFYQMEGGKALSIQFSYALDVEVDVDDQVATWNREYRFGRAFVDEEGDPFLKMDLDVERGFTSEGLANNVERWVSLLGEFYEYFGDSGAP